MSGYNLESSRPDSPAIKRQKHGGGGYSSTSNPNSGYNSGNDSGDDLFDGLHATPKKHLTQPTQILGSSPLRKATELQVPASSPFQTHNGATPQFIAESPAREAPDARHTSTYGAPLQRPPPYHDQQANYRQQYPQQQSRPSNLGSSMAPAGTQFRTPHGVVRAVAPRQKPKPIILDDDDGPRYRGTGSDDDNKLGTDIKPSSFSQARVQVESRARMPIMNGPGSRSIPPPQIPPTEYIRQFVHAPHNPAGTMSGYHANGQPPRRTDTTTMGHNQPRPLQMERQAYTGQQSLPSRAQPVQVDLRPHDEPNDLLRRKMLRVKEILPDRTYTDIRTALVRAKFNDDDAMFFLTSDELANADDVREESAPAPTMNAAKVNRVKIRDRFMKQPSQSGEVPIPKKPLNHMGHDNMANSDSQASEPTKPARRRLQQGRKRRDSTPSTTPVNPVHISIDSDEEVEADDDAVTPPSSPEPSKLPTGFQARVLQFLNTCNATELSDLVSINKAQAEGFVAAQPFNSLAAAEEYAVETKSGKKSTRAPIGEKIVDNAQSMMESFEAVDYLVDECNRYAQPLTKEMSDWGFDVFGASKTGELAMTSLEDQNDDDPQSKQRERPKTFVGQPTMMSSDITLKDYQVVGLNWLNLIWRQKLSCILADDMGLGKTCQVIAFLSHLVETGVTGPHLVVVPSSVLENWVREMERFSPGVVYEIYHGSQPERAAIAESIMAKIQAGTSEINVVFVTYDNSRRPEDNKFLRHLRPTVAIFDEGHALKNPNSQKYKALSKIRAQMRVLLTGTPLQNNLQELAAILGFILPDVFNEQAQHLDYIFKYKATTSDSDHSALLSAQRTQRAKEMLAPFVLRRKKEQVMKHMPVKTCRVQYCELEPAQAKIYNAFTSKSEELKRLRKEGITTKENGDVLKGENNPIMQLRKAAIHPLLFRRHFTDAKLDKMMPILKKSEPVEFKQRDDQVLGEMKLHSDFVLHGWCRTYPCIRKFDTPDLEWMNSGKVTALVELVKKYKENGDRVLIFSQFTMVLDILQEVLQTIQTRYLRIDGSTKVDDRQLLIDDFRDDETITAFLLSTGAGGQGLNLMYANKVIIFDQSFNPQDDVQAENRAHRVGQTRPVEIVRLITKDSIEVAMYILGQSKLELDNKVSGGSSSNGKSLEQQVMEMMENGKTTATIEGADDIVKVENKEVEIKPIILPAEDEDSDTASEESTVTASTKLPVLKTSNRPSRTSRTQTQSPTKSTHTSTGRNTRSNTKSPTKPNGGKQQQRPAAKTKTKKPTGIKISLRKKKPQAKTESSDSELSEIEEPELSLSD